MALLVSAKGSDVLAWRAAGDFAASFRQTVLGRMEFCRSEEAVALLDGASRELEELARANDAFCARCAALIDDVRTCTDPGLLRDLTADFYDGLYGHCAAYHAAPAFYQFSNLFLQALSASVCRTARESLGEAAARLPESALIALGPAGRQEFSPFCPLQFILVSGDPAAADDLLLHRFADALHEGFAGCGLPLDDDVTPRNSHWRGSLSDWKLRLAALLDRGEFGEIVEALRLADQTCLDGSVALAADLRKLSLDSLAASPAAMNNLVSRVVALSNGIGIMGGIRYEKSGPYRGQFALLDNALQPLSASVSALGLLKELETTATPRRIRELLWRRDLNVDMSERLLQAWHTLHELRLLREAEVRSDWRNTAPLHLFIEQQDNAGQEALRSALEAIGTIQRHVGLNFSGAGE